MKTQKTNEPIIIEDAVWFDFQDGVYKNLAESTFYYTFLMENVNQLIQGQQNAKAAADFKAYEEIYTFLLNRGILKEFCLDYSEIYGGATFSFNLTEAMKQYDLKSILTDEFDGRGMNDYIQTFCNPVDGFRCSVCGAITLSRHIAFDDEKGIKSTFCISCYPLNDAKHKELRRFYSENGCMATVQKRIQIVKDMSISKIAEGLTTNMLLDTFMRDQIEGTPNYNHKVDIIRKVLEESGRKEFECFPYDEEGIVIWDRSKLSDLKVFYDTVVLNRSGTEIVIIYDKVGVCFVDDQAIRFACELTNDEELKKTLKGE